MLAPYWVLTISVVSLSFSAVFVRFGESDPIVIAAYRTLFASVMILPLLYFERRSISIYSRDIGIMVGIGVILAIHLGLWITSVTLTSIANSVILVQIHPIFVGAFGYLLFREKLSSRSVLGVGLGLLGILVMIGVPSGTFPQEGLGNIMAFLGGLALGAYLLLGKQLRQSVSISFYAFSVYSVATLVLFLTALVQGKNLVPGPDLGREITILIIYGFSAGIMGHTLYNWALRYVPATMVSLSLLGEPVIAPFLAFLIFRETVSIQTLLGGIMILVGIYLARQNFLRYEEDYKKS
ncbi:MAG: DMT family transporter [Nitrososphaerales archaeon]